MRSPVVSAAFAAALVLVPVANGNAPARSQEGDFSITNQAPVATTPFRRDLMRELQAWWDVHAYYPKHAANTDEGGTVKVRLQITPNGKIFSVTVAASSGSKTLDAAGVSAFLTGAVRPFPETEPNAQLDLALHYVLAHRHNEVLPAGYTPTPYRAPFTIANDPVKSVILETMLQKTCTGTVTRNGGMGQPWRGMRAPAEVVFFRKSDGTAWARFSEGALPVSVSPVVQIGNMVQFVGPPLKPSYNFTWNVWTLWPDGPNHMSGGEGSPIPNHFGAVPVFGLGGPAEFTCSPEVLPTVQYSSMVVQTSVTSPGDPP